MWNLNNRNIFNITCCIQVVYYQRLVRPLVPDTDVCKRTMRNRLEAVADIRSTVGLGAGGDSKLVGEELRRLPHTEQSNVLKVAGISINEIPDEFSLNLKLSLGLTWNQWRTLQRQWFFNIIIDCNFNGYEWISAVRYINNSDLFWNHTW